MGGVVEDRRRVTDRVAFAAVMLIAIAALGLGVLPSRAAAFSFHPENVRDWAQLHYSGQLYGDEHLGVCTCLAALAYRFGDSVPRVTSGATRERFYSTPDS